MWIVAIAWMYVAVLMALAEATATNGTVLGAVITLLLYGIAPLSLVMYLLGTPARRKARRAAEALALAQWRAQQSEAVGQHGDAQQPPEASGTSLTEPRSRPPDAP
jgi:hypothetical protein